MIFTNIKNIADKKKISISRLEREAGLSSGSIYKWNTVSPSVKSLKRVADILGVTVEVLLK